MASIREGAVVDMIFTARQLFEKSMILYLHYLLTFVKHMTLYLERGCSWCYRSMVLPQWFYH